MMGGPPTVANRKVGGELSTQVRHREYIGDISVTIPAGAGVQVAPWQIVQGPLAINPGVYDLFPWLSGVAAHYLQYEINGMVIEYVSTSGAAVGASANQSIGSIGMAVQYDSIQPPYASKQEMLNDQMAVSGAPYANLLLGVECAPQLTPLTKQYVRTAPPPPGTDQRLYDLGQVYVAVDGIQGTGGTTVTLGELWVSYDVILMKSTLTEVEPPPIPGPPVPTECPLTYIEGLVGTSGVFNWGSQVWDVGSGGSQVNHYNTLGVIPTSNNLLTFPVLGSRFGTYIFQVDLTFSNAVQGNSPAPIVTGGPGGSTCFNFARRQAWDLGGTGQLLMPSSNMNYTNGCTVTGPVGTTNGCSTYSGQIFLEPTDAITNIRLASSVPAAIAMFNLGWDAGSNYQIRVSLVPKLAVNIPMP